MAQKLAVVYGATGNQGLPTVDALLELGNYRVRGVVRNLNSDSAKALVAKGVELVQASLDDEEALRGAFEGSHFIYAGTNFYEPFSQVGAAKAQEIEIRWGMNLARAAAATPTLEHYIWSGHPDTVGLTEGKAPVPHFVSKYRVNDYIKQELPGLLAKTTFLHISWYDVNFDFPMWTPLWVPSAGKYVGFGDFPADMPMLVIGDVRRNLAPFVQEIVRQGDRTRHGAIVVAGMVELPLARLLEMWAEAHGKEAVYVRTDTETWNKLWPGWVGELVSPLLNYMNVARSNAWKDLHQGVLTKEDLGIKTEDFIPLEESLKRLNY